MAVIIRFILNIDWVLNMFVYVAYFVSFSFLILILYDFVETCNEKAVVGFNSRYLEKIIYLTIYADLWLYYSLYNSIYSLYIEYDSIYLTSVLGRLITNKKLFWQTDGQRSDSTM